MASKYILFIGEQRQLGFLKNVRSFGLRLAFDDGGVTGKVSGWGVE